MNPALLSSERMDWETPADLFAALDQRFRFGLDVCALPSNTKCARFFSPADDGLAQEWRGACWMNPPYGRKLPAWMRKARASALEGATVVCLVPARTDTRWWQDLVTTALGDFEGSYWQPASATLVIVGSRGTVEIRFLRGRVKFGGARNGAPFPSAIVAYIGRAP